MDRENVGGNMSGQQSNYVSRGGNPANNKWSLDGVDITDMASTGFSPGYYDFDAFEEMTINTGGVDVTQQNGGVGMQFVTKSGTESSSGTGRVLRDRRQLRVEQHHDAQRSAGRPSGNPIQNIKDYGVEVGGPIEKGRAWVGAATASKTSTSASSASTFPPRRARRSRTPMALGLAVAAVNDCLNTDKTMLQTTNLKGEVQIFKGNKLSLFNSSDRRRSVTPAAPTTCTPIIETTNRQGGRAVNLRHNSNWITGPSPTYKFSDRLGDLGPLAGLGRDYSHVGNNFILDIPDDGLAERRAAGA